MVYFVLAMETRVPGYGQRKLAYVHIFGSQLTAYRDHCAYWLKATMR